MKTMQGATSIASWKSCRTFASDSPAGPSLPLMCKSTCHCQLYDVSPWQRFLVTSFLSVLNALTSLE